MRQRSFIALAVLLVLLVVGAVGVYAYDKSRNDVIAKGVSAGGVDISGLKAKQARARLQRELAKPLQRPVVVKYAGHRYVLSAARARVRVNTADMVAQALSASHSGGILSRTTRELTGGSVHTSIPVVVTYDRHAVAEFARHLARRIDKPAVDATISFSG